MKQKKSFSRSGEESASGIGLQGGSGLPGKSAHMLLCMAALMVVPVYLYGTGVLALLAAGLVTALVLDLIYMILTGWHTRLKRDMTSMITAFAVVLLLPATAPVWLVCVGVAIGLCLGKYPFGGTGKTIFNPAAVGLAFLTLCWPELMETYPLPFPFLGNITNAVFSPSPASFLRAGGTPSIDYLDVLLGKFAGPMGATCMIVLGAVAVYLFFQKALSLRVLIPACITLGLFAILFPRLDTGRVSSLVYEFSSGAFVFGIVCMASDPVTMPRHNNGRIFYGVLIGVLVMLFRYFGKFDLEFVFAILICNVFAGSCDRYASRLNRFAAKLWARLGYGKKTPGREGGGNG